MMNWYAKLRSSFILATCLGTVAHIVSCSGTSEEPNTEFTAESDVVFTSNRSGNGEIYVIEAGDTTWVNLTNAPSGENWPVWSPDGSRILFQSDRTGNLDVWVMEADGSNPRQLTDHPEPDYVPSWSPDGTWIIFTSWRTKTPEEERAPRLYRMDADGANTSRLVETSLGASGGAEWSPDGKSIFITRKLTETGADIYIRNLESGEERALTQDTLFNGSTSIAPNGKQIAFYADSGAGSAIKLLNLDSGEQRILLSDGYNYYPHWSNDGKNLLVTVARDSTFQDLDVVRISVDNPEERAVVAGGPGRESEGSWRPSRRSSR